MYLITEKKLIEESRVSGMILKVKWIDEFCSQSFHLPNVLFILQPVAW